MLKIIISPAKKMNHIDDVISWEQLPTHLQQATEIKDLLMTKTYQELKTIWQCNDQITKLNQERLQTMSLTTRLTPALLAYVGLQFQYMAPQTFTYDQWNYVRQHLFILSGFYGILGATDGITPYRLEMQAKLQINNTQNLYDYWQNTIYNMLSKDTSVIINLASKEYSKTIEKYLDGNVKMLTCTFGELTEVNGIQTVKTKATAVKMARGEMVRYMAEHDVQEVAQLKSFRRLNYTYSTAHSTDENYIFLKENEQK